VDMCSHCRLATPSGPDELCYACAIAIRADVRRGLDAIEEHLRGWMTGSEGGSGAGPEPPFRAS
jgi:hypothetical protein